MLFILLGILGTKTAHAANVGKKEGDVKEDNKAKISGKDERNTNKSKLFWEIVLSNNCKNRQALNVHNFRGYGLISSAPWLDIKHTDRNYTGDRTEAGVALPLNKQKNFQFRFSYADDFDGTGQKRMISSGYRLIKYDYNNGYGIQFGFEENSFDSIGRGIGYIAFGKQKRLSLYGGAGYQKYDNSWHNTVTLMYVSPGNIRVLAGPVSNTGENTGFMGSLNLFSSNEYNPDLTFYSYYVDIPSKKTIMGWLFALGKPGSPINTNTTFSFPGGGVSNQVLYDEVGVLMINPTLRAFSISSLHPDGTDWKEKWEYGGTVLAIKRFKFYGSSDYSEAMLYRTFPLKCTPHIGLGISRLYASGKETCSTMIEAGVVMGDVKLRVFHNNEGGGIDNMFFEARIKF